MREGNEHIDELIARVLAGEARPEEMETLKQWRSASAENENYYLESEKIFAAIDDAASSIELNEDDAWQKLQQKITHQETAQVIPFYRRAVVLRAAAGLALLLVLAIVSRQVLRQEEIPPLVLASTLHSETKKLPDGSKVVLNKNTELRYSLTEQGERKVHLKGEAFFEVVHDEHKPFVVEVEDVMVRDIGTAFNVKALPEANTIEVVVESGEVQFYSSGDVGLRLVKGEKAMYDRSNRHFTKMLPVPTENTGAYRLQHFEFKETSLREVVAQLNASCPVVIRLADKDLEELKLSVLFHHEEPENMVDIIADTFDLDVQKNDSLYILKRKTEK